MLIGVVRLGIAERDVGVTGLGNIRPGRPQHKRRGHLHTEVAHFERDTRREATACGVTIEDDVVGREALLGQRLEDTDDLVGRLLPPGMRREGVVHRNDAQTGFGGEEHGRLDHGLGRVQHVCATVSVDCDLVLAGKF